jgi:hypothetical protein
LKIEYRAKLAKTAEFDLVDWMIPLPEDDQKKSLQKVMKLQDCYSNTEWHDDLIESNELSGIEIPRRACGCQVSSGGITR